MNFDEYPDITDYKLKALGKVYVAYTYYNPTRDMQLFMEKTMDIIEEFSQDVLAFVGRFAALMMKEKEKEDDQ